MKPLVGTNLKRFHRAYKRTHAPEYQLAAILQSVEYPANVGSCFRVADGAGMEELLLTGITPTPPHPTIDKIGRFKSQRVPWRHQKDPLQAVAMMKEEGYRVVALEISDTAVPYHTYPYPQKTCLVLGHEDHGVTKATLNVCDAAVFLPMYGKGLSLNVHVALSIVVYHILHCQESR